MGSKASTTSPPTSVKVNIIPRVPQEIIDEILGHITTSSYYYYAAVTSLRSCSLVSKSWVPTCQRHLFRTISFTSWNIGKWLKAFPVPEESPARHVRDLSVQIGGRDCVPEDLFQHTLWFGNVRKVTLLGDWYGRRIHSFWKLPQSVTFLAIKTDVFTLMDIWELLERLPNLNNLFLPGSLADDVVQPGIEGVPRGRFGGQLQLLRGSAHQDLTNMLLEVPTGLRFAKVDISCDRECSLLTVRLVEACAKTLVKLSLAISAHGKPHSLQPGWF